ISDSEAVVPPGFRTDRTDHADLATDRVAVAAPGGAVHRSSPNTVFAADRHDVHDGGADCDRIGAHFWYRAGGGGDGRHGVGGVPSGIVARGADGFRGAAWAGAVPIPGGRQRRVLDGTPAGGVYRASGRTA